MKKGFTLAEMMVVMLILSIVMAAFAPIMTRRNKTDFKSPWATVNNDASGSIYFINSKVEDLASARIGFDGSFEELRNNANYARLLVNVNNNNQNAIGFLRGSDTTPQGVLRLYGSKLLLGSTVNTDTNDVSNYLKDYTMGIGYDLDVDGVHSIAIGRKTKASKSSVAIGYPGTAYTTMPDVNGGTIEIENNLNNTTYTSAGESAVAVGASADAGTSSVAVGRLAKSGDYAIAVGRSTSAGESAVAIGYEAKASESNFAIGYQALKNNSTGTNNMAIGQSALTTNTTGAYNTAIGYESMKSNEKASYNIAIGYQSMISKSSGGESVAIGPLAMERNSGERNIAIGYSALRGRSRGVDEALLGNNNIAIGYEAMQIASGNKNIAILVDTPTDSNTHDNNTNDKSFHRSEGNNNIAIGSLIFNYGMGDHTVANSGGSNIILGENILSYNYGSNNIAIGHNIMSEVNGSRDRYYHNRSNNIAIGDNTLKNVKGGNYNIAIGDSALQGGDLSANNIAIGQNACTNVTGNNKICIGNNSGPQSSDSTTDETVYIGGKSYFNGGDAVLEVHNPNYNNGTGYLQGWSKKDNSGKVDTSNPSSTVVINGNLVVKGLIMSRIGNGEVTNPAASGYAKILFGTNSNGNDNFNDLVWKNGPDNSDAAKTLKNLYGSTYGFRGNSDHRLKNITGANSDGLSKIQQLKVYNFTFKQDPKKMPHTGVIAQDLQKIFPNSVIKGEDGYLVIRWDEMFYAMINAVKELAAKINVIDSRVTRLEKENAELRARLLALEKKLK